MSCLARVTFAVLITVIAPQSAMPQLSGSAGRTLAVGTRIRVTAAPTVDDGIGVVVSHRADTLVYRLESGNGLISVPTEQITRLDMSGGMQTSMLRKAAYGVVGGAAIGAGIGFLSYKPPPACTGDFICFNLGSGIPAMFGAMIGGASGLVLGTLFGMRETERWNSLLQSGVDGIRARVSSAGQGIILSASRSF